MRLATLITAFAVAVLTAVPMTLTGSPTWKEVETNVYRFGLWWHPLPGLVAPVAVWLIREPAANGATATGDKWVLIDSGPADRWTQAHASQLVKALKAKVAPGQLQAILLTHTHGDHAGGVPQLLEAYPEAPVVVPEGEAPFLLGESDFLQDKEAGPLLRALQALGLAPLKGVTVPRERLRTLPASASPSGAPTSEGLRQLGVTTLAWMPTPGHSPPHVSYLHEPSGTILAGDAVILIQPWLALGGKRQAGASKALVTERPITALIATLGRGGNTSSFSSIPVDVAVAGGKPLLTTPAASLYITPTILCPLPMCDHEQYQRSVCHLAGLQFSHLHPSHDATGGGMSKEQVAAFAAHLPACGK